MSEEAARRYRVYVSKSGRLFIEGAFASEGDATGYALSIKDHYPVVCVRSVFRPSGATAELEEDVLVLRGGQEVPLKAGPAEAGPARAIAAPARHTNRVLVNSVTALLLLAIALVVIHMAVLPLWGAP